MLGAGAPTTGDRRVLHYCGTARFPRGLSSDEVRERGGLGGFWRIGTMFARLCTGPIETRAGQRLQRRPSTSTIRTLKSMRRRDLRPTSTRRVRETRRTSPEASLAQSAHSGARASFRELHSDFQGGTPPTRRRGLGSGSLATGSGSRTVVNDA